MTLSLTTRLAILQQGEYEWKHYLEWTQKNPDYPQEVTPKDWTLKLKLLHFFASILFFLPTNYVLFGSLALLSVPQRILAYFLIRQAMAKLRTLQKNGLVVITIAGSYAKTSTKYIASHVLSQSNKTLMTPGNINRALGIAKLIREDLTPEHKIFIVELGEYDPGDLSFLVRFVQPSLKILTPVTFAHLERFSSKEDLEKELLSYLTTGQSKAMLSHEDNRSLVEKYAPNLSVDFYGKSQISKEEVSRAGTEYTYTTNGQSLTLYIPLFGSHNAVNTLPALWCAHQLGIPLDSAVGSLANLPPIPHRLEPTQLEQNILLLDNGYNSNPKSAVESLATLQKLDGSQKIVFTPGFVELGSEQETANETLGEQIAAVADLCVVIQGINTEAIKRGLLNGKMKEQQIIIATGEQEGMNLITGKVKPSAIILFENSIPELYKR